MFTAMEDYETFKIPRNCKSRSEHYRNKLHLSKAYS